MRKIFALTLALVLTLGASTVAMAAWFAAGTGSGSAAAGSLAEPGPPSVSRQSGAPTTVDITWSAVSTATTYEVRRFTTSTATTGGTLICSVAATGCSDTDAATASAHWYRLTAHRSQWASQISDPAHVPAQAVLTMHIADLDDATSPGGGPNWSPGVNVEVRDSTGAVVDGATVSMSWSATRGGDTLTGTASCPTGASGRCPANAGSIPNGYSPAVFTVTDVTHPTISTYVSADNDDPDGDSDGTEISITK